MYKVFIGNICFNFRKLSDADYFARKNGKVVFGIAKRENEKEFTMKVSEMNARQKRAFYNIYWAANDLIGGLENTLLDYPEDSDEYKSAYALLHDHDRLVKALYENATTAVYSEGFCGFGKQYQMEIRDINFCGKDWLMERCEKRITKEGY